MSKLTPDQRRKLEQSTPEISEDRSPSNNSQLLAAARAKQETDLAELQNSMDALSSEFATRAEEIVRLGLQNSYSQARQRIGAIDLSFFGNGENLPHSNDSPALMPVLEAEVTA